MFGSIVRKSTVYARPSWSTLSLVIWVREEWRRFSAMLPKLSHPTSSACVRACAEERSTAAATATPIATRARDFIACSIVFLVDREAKREAPRGPRAPHMARVRGGCAASPRCGRSARFRQVPGRRTLRRQIGRASCRERVEVLGGAQSLIDKNTNKR